MILADKMIALRKRAGWSQEELAEKMGVSRQSVSKWEGAQSMPDLDKILALSRIFGVSTDYLLKDEIEDVPCPAQDTAPEEKRRRVSMEDANRYLNLRRQAAPKLAIATALCILSPIALILLDALSETTNRISEGVAAGVGLAALLGLVAVAVACVAFVWCGTVCGAMDRLLEEGDFRRQVKAHKSVKGAISVIYWVIVTAVFLFLTWGPNGNGQPRYSWMVWAIGGILYAGVMALVGIFEKSET